MFPDKLEKANKMLKTAKLPPKKVGSKQDWKSCDYNSSGFKSGPAGEKPLSKPVSGRNAPLITTEGSVK
jgi:hypothetical protein